MFPPTPKFILIINAINLTFNYYKIINIIQIFKICTLVTAGLYLLVRSSPILEYSPTALLVITLIGSITAFVAATCGLVQNDIKRIIAFSKSCFLYKESLYSNSVYLSYDSPHHR